MEKDKKYISDIKKYMIEQLKENIDDVEFNGNCTDFENSLFKILSVSFPKISESEMMLFNLDIHGISVLEEVHVSAVICLVHMF